MARGPILSANRWPGKLYLQLSPTADFRFLVSEFAFRHRYGTYTQLPEKVSWAFTLLNDAQQQVFIRLYGLDGQARRTQKQIAAEVITSDNWVSERKAEIIEILVRQEFGEIIQGKKELPN